MTSAYVVIKWPACYKTCPVDRSARNFDDWISEVPLYIVMGEFKGRLVHLSSPPALDIPGKNTDSGDDNRTVLAL